MTEASDLSLMSVTACLGVAATLHELKRAKVLDDAAIARIGDFMLGALPGLDEGSASIRSFRESLLDRLEEVLRTPYE